MVSPRSTAYTYEIENVAWRERFIMVDEIHRIDSKRKPCETLGNWKNDSATMRALSILNQDARKFWVQHCRIVHPRSDVARQDDSRLRTPAAAVTGREMYAKEECVDFVPQRNVCLHIWAILQVSR